MFLAAARFLGMFHVYLRPTFDVFLSLSRFSLSLQFTSLESSPFLFHPYELEIESYSRRARPRVSGRSRSGVSCFVSNFFQFVRLFARVGRVGGGVLTALLVGAQTRSLSFTLRVDGAHRGAEGR